MHDKGARDLPVTSYFRQILGLPVEFKTDAYIAELGSDRDKRRALSKHPDITDEEI